MGNFFRTTKYFFRKLNIDGFLKRKWLTIFLCLLFVSLTTRLIFHLIGYPWAGLEDLKFKTLWDWLELLLIPAAVAGIGLYIEKSERKADREIAKDNQLENALQSYFDSMSHLIINNGLKTSQKDDEIREISQVKTMTTFERMDVERKAKILMFLSGTKLITTIGKEQIPIISLDSINLEELPVKYPSYQLQGANLEWAWLSYADLSSSDLSYANLTQAEIINANLDRADLRGAIFESANLKDSYFYGADLEGSNLRDSCIFGANFTDANLSGVKMTGAVYNKRTKWPKGFDPKKAGAVFKK